MGWTFADSSIVAGYISILFWLIVFIPQLLENYKRKNGDGLSLSFLFIWLAGDIFNLAAIIMERLMFTMFLLALWYTVADICLIWQVVYYKQCVTTEPNSNEDEAVALIATKTIKQRRPSVLDSSDEVSDEEEEALDNDIVPAKEKMNPIWINLIGFLVLTAVILTFCYAYVIVKKVDDENSIRLIPQILGWSSAVLYVGSRVPQLIKNWRQQSTDGLSSGMFICAVFGNLFFASSIFLKSTERRYIIVNLSWIIGSLGTVIFDIMIFLQFYVFNRRKLKHRAD
ncbi:hypothetical protein INT47_002014 [Mucor saturninus]|uniref:PQ-loop-domain-containing protein n=1 Tax=Mucor saturninus TaxID=64648 RepID=A0A8H7QZN3_9FUNG|nr:hypothetical protein INT47_002014 [Mucor saturninus]